MKWLLVVALWVCAGTSAGYAQESESDARSKIIELENVWNQAAEVKDLKALDAILDDNFVYVEADGKLLSKPEVLADVKASRGVQVFSESMIVHLHGDTAVVTGIYRTTGMEHGKPFVRRDRFVDTWRRENGAWVSVASLTTPMA